MYTVYDVQCCIVCAMRSAHTHIPYHTLLHQQEIANSKTFQKDQTFQLLGKQIRIRKWQR